MASIQEELRAVLGADPDLVELVADRIYPGQIPDDEDPTPWLFYAVPESVPFPELGDDDPVAQYQVEFHALADTYAEAKAIIDATIAALNGYAGGQISRAFWAGTSEETTEEGYHHVCRADVWATTASIIAITPRGGRITTGAGFVRIVAGGQTVTLTSAGLSVMTASVEDLTIGTHLIHSAAVVDAGQTWTPGTIIGRFPVRDPATGLTGWLPIYDVITSS